MKIKLKHFVEFLTAFIYAVLTMAFFRKNRKTVIYYHSILPEDTAHFEKQIRYLSRKYAAVKASGILNTKLKKNAVAVTFDDGFENFYENAFPVLKKYSVPATVFIPAGMLGKTANWQIEEDCHDNNQPIMNGEHLRELTAYNIEFMSHTLTHVDLTKISYSQLLSQLSNSRQILESTLDTEVTLISYPYGSYNHNVKLAARKTGYKLGFTIEPDFIANNQNQLSLPRIAVSPQDNIFSFALKLNGSYRVVKYLRNLKKHLKTLFKLESTPYVLQGN